MVYILGVNEHVSQVIDVLKTKNIPIEGIFDDIIAQQLHNAPISPLSHIVDYKILGTLAEATILLLPTDFLFCGTSDNLTRKEIATMFSTHTFINVISPYSLVNPSVNLGQGNFIGNFVNILNDCVIGNQNIVSNSSLITSGIKIGSYNHIKKNCKLKGMITINDFNVIGPRTNITPRIFIGDNNIIASDSSISDNIASDQVVLQSLRMRQNSCI